MDLLVTVGSLPFARLQLTVIVVFGLSIGLAYDKITNILPLFVVFYGLFNSSGNLGPGDMLGLISSESYATAVRGTCYGISAALGKTGAAVGVEAFTPIQTNLGKKWTFIIAAICGVAGVLVTFFFVRDLKGEDLAEEDERFRAYLVGHGWSGEMGEDDLVGLASEGVNPALVEEVVGAESPTALEEGGRGDHREANRAEIGLEKNF